MKSSMTTVLQTAYHHAFKIQSDFAREFAQEVAALCSMGLITTLESPGQYGRRWRVTAMGIDALKKGGLL